MKNLFFLTLIGSMFLASCSSDEPLSSPIEAASKKVPVTINIASNNEFNELRSVSPSDIGLESMYYFVYDEATGNFIKQKFFSAGNMEVIKDSLPEGRYRIAVIAAKEYGYLEDEEGFKLGDFLNANINFNLSSFKFIGMLSRNTDIFYTNSVLDVGKTAVQESIVLKRITSKIEIIPQDLDKLPDNFMFMTLNVTDVGYQLFNFADNTYSSMYYSWGGMFDYPSVPDDELRRANEDNPLVIITLPLKSSFEELDENGQPQLFPIAAHLVPVEGWPTKIVIKNEYTLEPNKILRLRGNLFGNGENTTNNEISVDTEWDAEVVEENFD